MKKIGFLVLVVLTALFTVACKDDPPKSTRWDQAASVAASAASAAASAPPVPKTETGEVNKFFPKEEAGIKLVFTVDKPGYAEAKLMSDGGELAMFTVGDADAAAVGKFGASTEKVGTYPLVTVGKNQSAILVGTRQVKISSKTLDPDARKAWLGKFDLAGLAVLPPPASSAN